MAPASRACSGADYRYVVLGGPAHRRGSRQGPQGQAPGSLLSSTKSVSISLISPSDVSDVVEESPRATAMPFAMTAPFFAISRYPALMIVSITLVSGSTRTTLSPETKWFPRQKHPWREDGLAFPASIGLWAGPRVFANAPCHRA
jgi:hypothetical protein